MSKFRDVSMGITTASGAPIDLLTLSDICRLEKRDRVTIWRWYTSGKFPKPWIMNGRTIGWFRVKYEAWLESKK